MGVKILRGEVNIEDVLLIIDNHPCALVNVQMSECNTPTP
jgi:hypothetical protein